MARPSITSALLAALAAAICAFDAAQAQTYPTRPVTIVVPGAAGGGGDFTARLVGEQLSKALGQQFVFENNQWDPIKSFAPVALAIKAPHAMVAKKDLPAANLLEFIAYAKQNPGKINFGSAGPGSIQHIGGEQLARLIGTKMVHVAYRGAALAMNDLLAGSIELLITTPPPVVGHLRAASVKGLAIASRVRHPMLPDLPTAAEAGLPGFELDAWFGFYAPSGTPQPVVDRLAAEIETIVKSDD